MPWRQKHAKISTISHQQHDGERKTQGIRWRLTGIHLDRADARCVEDPEV